MPKVSLHYGLTLPIPGQQYTNVKADVSFDGIDTEGDVAAQVARCVEVLGQVAEGADGALAQQASNLSGLAIDGLGLPKELADLKRQMTTVIKRLVDEVTRHKEQLEALHGKPADARGKGRARKASPVAAGSGDGSPAPAEGVAPPA